MGASISISHPFSENALLRRFVGLEQITDNDPFWNALTAFNWNVDEKKQLSELDELTTDLADALRYNTLTTGNLSALVRVFIRRSLQVTESQLTNDTMSLWQTANCLVIIRHSIRALIARDAPVIELYNVEGDEVERLVEGLIDILIDGKDVNLREESAKTLLLLLATHDRHVLGLMMPSQSNALCESLLNTFVTPQPCVVREGADAAGGSLVLGFASSMVSALSWTVGVNDEVADEEGPLSHLALLLLVCLACHKRPVEKGEEESNPYRHALSTFTNTQDASSTVTTFSIDYSLLYARLCVTVQDDAPMLLLYLVLHANYEFRNFVLSRVDLERLVVPTLQVLHLGQQAPSPDHHVYLALVALLILSEDEFYCKVIHETTIRNVTWYSAERTLTSISLGGLVALVLTRTVQLNIVKMRDRYLHANSLAALSNMSPYCKNLPAIVSQRFVALVEALNKRHDKLVMAPGNMQDELSAVDDALRTLLDLLNRCLAHQLRSNSELIYAMLYKRAVFDSLPSHAATLGIGRILDHFGARVTALGANATVPQVLNAIQQGALQWPSDRFGKVPDVTFRYVEDENTDEFFVPYVDKLVKRDIL